jgi:hypothetical protein
VGLSVKDIGTGHGRFRPTSCSQLRSDETLRFDSQYRKPLYPSMQNTISAVYNENQHMLPKKLSSEKHF